MDFIQDLISQVEPILTSTPVMVALAIALFFGILKKLIKLALTVGAILVILIILENFGYNVPGIM